MVDRTAAVGLARNMTLLTGIMWATILYPASLAMWNDSVTALTV